MASTAAFTAPSGESSAKLSSLERSLITTFRELCPRESVRGASWQSALEGIVTDTRNIKNLDVRKNKVQEMVLAWASGRTDHISGMTTVEKKRKVPPSDGRGRGRVRSAFGAREDRGDRQLAEQKRQREESAKIAAARAVVREKRAALAGLKSKSSTAPKPIGLWARGAPGVQSPQAAGEAELAKAEGKLRALMDAKAAREAARARQIAEAKAKKEAEAEARAAAARAAQAKAQAEREEARRIAQAEADRQAMDSRMAQEAENQRQQEVREAEARRQADAQLQREQAQARREAEARAAEAKARADARASAGVSFASSGLGGPSISLSAPERAQPQHATPGVTLGALGGGGMAELSLMAPPSSSGNVTSVSDLEAQLESGAGGLASTAGGGASASQLEPFAALPPSPAATTAPVSQPTATAGFGGHGLGAPGLAPGMGPHGGPMPMGYDGFGYYAHPMAAYGYGPGPHMGMPAPARGAPGMAHGPPGVGAGGMMPPYGAGRPGGLTTGADGGLGGLGTPTSGSGPSHSGAGGWDASAYTPHGYAPDASRGRDGSMQPAGGMPAGMAGGMPAGMPGGMPGGMAGGMPYYGAYGNGSYGPAYGYAPNYGAYGMPQMGGPGYHYGAHGGAMGGAPDGSTGRAPADTSTQGGGGGQGLAPLDGSYGHYGPPPTTGGSSAPTNTWH